MKKPLKITLISLLIFLLLVGAGLTIYYFCRPKGQTRGDIDIDPADNTYNNDTSKNIADCSPTESLFILAANLQNLDYYATLSGEVDAGGFYKQNVSGEKYKTGKDSLYVSRSTSLFKNTADQIFISGNAVLVRKGNPNTNVYEDTVTEYSLSAYLDEYGTDYRELSNYILKDATITSSEKVSSENGIYTYRYEIDITTGVDNYRVNMAKMGDLSEMPTFAKSTLEVAMTENFMPVTIMQIDEYSVNMLFTLKCKSTLVETFEKINDSTIVIPEYEFFKARLA